jgi:uncharacterized protein YjiS (DUF1127 family)
MPTSRSLASASKFSPHAKRQKTERAMEMIMSTLSTVLAPDVAGNVGPAARFTVAVVRVVQRWWISHTQRRMQRAATLILCRMSDRQLRDIGIDRGEIEFAVSRGRARSPDLRGAG